MVTQIRVTGEDVASLGAALHGLADGLGLAGEAAADGSWALGPGESAPLLREALTDLEHQQLVLARGLRHLGDLARHAGGAYVDVEADVGLAIAGEAMTREPTRGRWTGGGSW